MICRSHHGMLQAFSCFLIQESHPVAHRKELGVFLVSKTVLRVYTYPADVDESEDRHEVR